MFLNQGRVFVYCRLGITEVTRKTLEHTHLNLPRTGNIIQKVANIIVALFRSIQRAEKLVKYDIEQFPQ